MGSSEVRTALAVGGREEPKGPLPPDGLGKSLRQAQNQASEVFGWIYQAVLLKQPETICPRPVQPLLVFAYSRDRQIRAAPPKELLQRSESSARISPNDY